MPCDIHETKDIITLQGPKGLWKSAMAKGRPSAKCLLLSPHSPLVQILTLWLPWSTHSGLISSLVTLGLGLEWNSQRPYI